MSNDELSNKSTLLPFEIKHNLTDLKYAIKFGIKFRNIFFGTLTALPIYLLFKLHHQINLPQSIYYVLGGIALALTLIVNSCISQTTLDLLKRIEFKNIFDTFSTAFKKSNDILFPPIGVLIIVLFFSGIEWIIAKISGYFILKTVLYGVLYPIHLLIASFMIYSILVALFGVIISPSLSCLRTESQFDRVSNLYSMFWKYWYKFAFYGLLLLCMTVFFTSIFTILLKGSILLLDVFYNSNLVQYFLNISSIQNWQNSLFYHSTLLLIIGFSLSVLFSGISVITRGIEKVE